MSAPIRLTTEEATALTALLRTIERQLRRACGSNCSIHCTRNDELAAQLHTWRIALKYNTQPELGT